MKRILIMYGNEYVQDKVVTRLLRMPGISVVSDDMLSKLLNYSIGTTEEYAMNEMRLAVLGLLCRMPEYETVVLNIQNMHNRLDFWQDIKLCCQTYNVSKENRYYVYIDGIDSTPNLAQRKLDTFVRLDPKDTPEDSVKVIIERCGLLYDTEGASGVTAEPF